MQIAYQLLFAMKKWVPSPYRFEGEYYRQKAQFWALAWALGHQERSIFRVSSERLACPKIIPLRHHPNSPVFLQLGMFVVNSLEKIRPFG